MKKRRNEAMTKEVMKKQDQTLVAAQDMNEWGTEALESNDIMLPKLFLTQSTSELVGDGKAAIGDYVDSITEEKLGSITSPLEVIPFHMEKTYLTLKANGGEFVGKQADVGQTLPFEEMLPDGTAVKNYRTLDFYVLIPSQIKSGAALPYVLSFKSSSLKAGKKLATIMYVKNRMMSLPPAATVVELGGKKEKKETNTFAVADVKEKRKATNEELSVAFGWFKTVKKGGVKVDAKDEQSYSTQPGEGEFF
jgi:hypothetical protein